ARVAQIGVAAIERARDAPVGEEMPDVGSRGAEQRAQEASSGGPHAGEPATASPAEKAEQERLRLVVRRVTEHDARRADLAGHRYECAVASTASARFERRSRRERQAPLDQRDAPVGA